MMSTPLIKVYKKAIAYDKNLKSDDPRFRHSVHIVHEDGSVFYFRDAFLMKHTLKDPKWKDDGEWIIVFAEHHEVHVYAKSELALYSQTVMRDGGRGKGWD